jgi:hypothetical protein
MEQRTQAEREDSRHLRDASGRERTSEELLAMLVTRIDALADQLSGRKHILTISRGILRAWWIITAITIPVAAIVAVVVVMMRK